MANSEDTHYRRQSPYIEPHSRYPPRRRRKDEAPETLHQDAVEYLATFTEDLQIHTQPSPTHQRQDGYTYPQVGQAASYNTPGPWPSPRRVPRPSPYAAMPEVNGGYYGTYFTAGNPRGQHPSGYPSAQPFGAGNPAEYYQAQSHRTARFPAAYDSEAYVPGAYEQEARRSVRHVQNANPLLPRPYPPTHPSHDLFAQDPSFCSQEDRLRRRMFRDEPTNVSEHLRNFCPPHEIPQYWAPPPPESGIFLPPQMTNSTRVGRHQQSTTGRSGMTVSTEPAESRKATTEDAERLNIPKGYSLKLWNPDEKPIFLLSNVFDYNSIGKWIFDWTGDVHGSPSPMKEMAGDIWLALIEFYGKIKMSEEFIDRNSGTRNRKLHEVLNVLSEFIGDAEILMEKLDRLLRKCEKPMLKTASGNRDRLGKKAGHAFVDTLFGRDQLLKETEKLQQSLWNWVHQWNSKCAESVCSYPTTQHYRQQIPAQYPPAYPPAQHSTGSSPGGFHHAGHTYRRPPQGGYAPVQPPPVPQSYQQPPRHFPRQPSWATGWHEIRPDQDGFATPPSGYRRGQFEYQAGSAFDGQEKPHRHRGQHRATRPRRYSTDEFPQSDDDAGAGHDKSYSQESRNTDSPILRDPKKRDATLEDAAKHGIPPEYDLQNWDPDEEPIVFCGAIYNAFSLGRWIVHWAIIAHGLSAAETYTAEELWYSMIEVAARLQRSKKFVSRCKVYESLEQAENKEMVEDFIEAGERLTWRLQMLVRECDEVMLDPDKKDTGQLREGSGIAFVHAIFSSETHSEKTTSLMQGMRLWIDRWERNCKEVIKAGLGIEQPVDDAVDGDQDSDS